MCMKFEHSFDLILHIILSLCALEKYGDEYLKRMRGMREAKVQRHSCCKHDLGICGIPRPTSSDIHTHCADFTHGNLGKDHKSFYVFVL